jgi:hypothetical protein
MILSWRHHKRAESKPPHTGLLLIHNYIGLVDPPVKESYISRRFISYRFLEEAVEDLLDSGNN